MLEIKCPNCEAKTKGLVRDYLQWRSDRRICPNCGVQLEISNPILCFGLCGLVFGFVVGSSYYWSFGNACPPFFWRKWLSLVMAILICWIVLPVIVRAIGRWQVLASGQKSIVWSRVIAVSLSALAIAFGITYCIVRLTFEAVVR